MRIFKAREENSILTAIVVGFKLTDTDTREDYELSEKIKEQNKQLEAFNSFGAMMMDTFVAALHVNLNDYSQVVYRKNDILDEEYKHFDNYLIAVTIQRLRLDTHGCEDAGDGRL